MIHLKISEIKHFMAKLLLHDNFDHFLLLEASVSMGNTFTIDGHRNRAFFSKEEYETLTAQEYPLTPWKQMRSFFYEIIKGIQPPSRFHITFQLPMADTKQLIEHSDSSFLFHDVSGLFLHLKYDGSSLKCITGTSYHIFSLDKSLDDTWDQTIQSLFRQMQIAFEVQ